MILFSVRLEFPAALPVADNIHVRTFGDNAQAMDLRPSAIMTYPFDPA